MSYNRLVTDNPTLGRLFPFGKKNLSYDQLIVDSQVKSHGRRVMDTVGTAVAGLDDFDLLVPILEELAQRHHQYGVTKKNFKVSDKTLKVVLSLVTVKIQCLKFIYRCIYILVARIKRAQFLIMHILVYL